MTPPTTRRLEPWQGMFLALAAIWGSSFLFIKLIGERWPALWVAFGRVSLGAATLLVMCAVARRSLRFPLRVWGHLTVTALLFNAVPFTLFAEGERHVSSIVAGLWNATTPLWTVVGVVAFLPGERPTRTRALGLGLGFAGALLILAPWHAFSGGRLDGELECGVAALCYGAAFTYTRRFVAGRPEGPIALSAGQLLIATVMVAVTLPFAGTPQWTLGAGRIAGVLSLGILGSGIAYVMNYEIIRQAGATVSSTVTYLIPVFSTVLGIIVLGETLTWNEPLGGLVILCGVALTQRSAQGTRSPNADDRPARSWRNPRRRRPEPRPPAPATR